MIQNLPKDVKENAGFCLWRYEEQNGRRTKVPYRVNGKRASSKNIRHFTSFAEVLKATAQYDGIGIGGFAHNPFPSSVTS